jgi:hypothetical protein
LISAGLTSSGGALLDGLAKRRTTHALSCYLRQRRRATDTLEPSAPSPDTAILADAGLKAMGVRKPHAVTDIRASCEIHSSAPCICLLYPQDTCVRRSLSFHPIKSSVAAE